MSSLKGEVSTMTLHNQKNVGRRKIIAVIGNASIVSGSRIDKIAEDVGRYIIDSGYRLLTGGLGGVMEAASRGGRSSEMWKDGVIIGIIPGSDPTMANPFVDISIPTSLDHGRNLIVAQADAVIAIGGGAGTLSEIAMAWIHKRLIIALRCGGWSEKLAGERLDHRVRYPEIPEDCVFGADSVKDVEYLLNLYLPAYIGNHKKITVKV
jgi:uncharacterized protein (TIGR00725 family)